MMLGAERYKHDTAPARMVCMVAMHRGLSTYNARFFFDEPFIFRILAPFIFRFTKVAHIKIGIGILIITRSPLFRMQNIS